jgi:hypothetical protein
MTAMTGLVEFHEAAWVHRWQGKYYLSHSDNNPVSRGGNRMRYAMSDSPLGPWKDMGVYIYPTGMDTDHGSIVRFKDQWWAFYHTSNVSGDGTLRSVCVDPLVVRPDGTLEVVRNWGTPAGGKAPVLEADGPLRIEAERFNDGGYHYGYFKRSSREDTPSVGSDATRGWVESLATGDWVRYSFEAAAAGKYTVECSVRTAGSSDARVMLSVNGTHPESDGITVGGAGQWRTVTMSGLDVAAGENYLELRVLGGGQVGADYFTIKTQ